MELRVGMMVRYVGKSLIKPSGIRIPSPYTGEIGFITKDLGVVLNNSGKMSHMFWVDIDLNVDFYKETLIPINPDNEPAGSFEDMMEDLNKEAVK